MNYIVYLLFRSILLLFKIIPFRILYILSDFLIFIFIYVFPYRKKIIIENLKTSFPEKSEKEINLIYRKFIRNFCDMLLETAKAYTTSGKKLLPRFKVKNRELVDDFYKKGKSVIWTMSHYANWEWCSKALIFQHLHSIITFYKPLSNKYIDKFVREQRLKGLYKVFSVYENNKVFGNPNDKEPIAVAFIADQSPTSMKNAVWVRFLNQDTPCIGGMDMYSKRYDVPVIHMDIQRVKRGYYEVEYVLLCDKPKELPKYGEITSLFMKNLEKIIRRKPEDWLWSHRRWKHVDEKPENAIVF